MRSVPAGSFERISAKRALWRAFQAYRKGKSREPAVAAFDLDADRHILGLHRDLISGDFQPGRYRLRAIRDPKLRLIAAPAVRDRVLHQALIDDIGPTFERGFHPASFACGSGRGPHRAVLRHLAFSRRFRHRLSLDIRRFFLSIHRPTLTELICRRLRPSDGRTHRLVGHLLEAGGAVYRARLATEILGLVDDPIPEDSGIAIGSYLSQWSGSLYLSALDHWITHELKVGGYVRFMDDFVLFHDDRSRLEEARSAIAEWLRQERRLELNPKRWRVLPTHQATIFLGYRISRSGISPGKKLKKRMRKRLRALRDAPADRIARSVRSYRGLMLFG